MPQPLAHFKPCSRAPNVSWGVHQSLAHPPTDVGGSWIYTLVAYRYMLVELGALEAQSIRVYCCENRQNAVFMNRPNVSWRISR